MVFDRRCLFRFKESEPALDRLDRLLGDAAEEKEEEEDDDDEEGLAAKQSRLTRASLSTEASPASCACVKSSSGNSS